jgi:predicted O-methyltransferase YrrM
MKFDEAKRFLSSRHIRTPCVDEELRWLNLQAYHVSCAYPDAKIVECGTLNGGTAIIKGAGIKLSKSISNERRNAKLWTVDSYKDYTDGKHPDLMSHQDIQNLISEAGLSEEVEAVSQDDIEYLRSLQPRSINMLFIDSLHTQEHVYETLNVALPTMADNSLLCGHDYCLPGYGVVYAVEDFKRENTNSVCGFGVHYKIWWMMVRRKQRGYMQRG